jgi:CheY-like chemotaxis protein
MVLLAGFGLGFIAYKKGLITVADGSKIPSRSLVPCDKSHVLIVDDEQHVREVFHMILTAGLPTHTIDTASNGIEAVDAFNSGHHAVLIMDLQMAQMDGQHAFAELQRRCKRNNWEMPSIIFCTGFAHPEPVRNIVMQNSTHCLLSKPVSAQTLLNAVKARLGLRNKL